MTRMRVLALATVLAVFAGDKAIAQRSSLGARNRAQQVGKIEKIAARESTRIERNAIYEQYSWTAVKAPPPKTFRVGDLITVVVRETRKFEADADLETKKKFDISSELDAFIDLTGGGVGEAAFRRGKPAIDYKYNQKFKGEGDTAREDRLTTRLTGTIIDVKPNGLLVLEAKARIQHDDEISVITLTGSCRKVDVSADNTVLSTQIADKEIIVNNQGALRAASSRGWITKLIDLLWPI